MTTLIATCIISSILSSNPVDSSTKFSPICQAVLDQPSVSDHNLSKGLNAHSAISFIPNFSLVKASIDISFRFWPGDLKTWHLELDDLAAWMRSVKTRLYSFLPNSSRCWPSSLLFDLKAVIILSLTPRISNVLSDSERSLTVSLRCMQFDHLSRIGSRGQVWFLEEIPLSFE